MTAPTASTWTGAGATDAWTDPANWSAGVPGAGTVPQFSIPGTWKVVLPAPSAGGRVGEVQVTAGSITFTAGALSAAAAGFDLPALQIGGGASLAIATGVSFSAVGQGAAILVGGPEGGGSLSVLGQVSAGYVQIGRFYPTGEQGGVLTVSGTAASLSATDIQIGGAAQGRMEAAAGATVEAGQIDIGVTQGGAAVQPGDTLGVSGAGTRVVATALNVGVANPGHLHIWAGAALSAGGGMIGGAVGQDAWGAVSVHGKGSSLTVGQTGLAVAGGPSASTLSLRSHATLTLDGTLTVSGRLVLDGTADVTGSGEMLVQGGRVAAASSGAGVDAVLHQHVVLAPPDTAHHPRGLFAAASGTRLVLDGRAGETGTGARLIADGGTVVLAHADNGFAHAVISQGTLEIAAAGAAGRGSLHFLGHDSSTLQLDPGIPLANTITGFGAGETIDLRGIAFDATTALDFVPDSGALTLTHGAAGETLHLAGSYAAAGFTLSADGHGGTDVGYVAQGVVTP